MNLPNEFKRLAMEFEKAVQGQQKELIVRYRKALEEARNLLRKQFDRYEKDGKLSDKSFPHSAKRKMLSAMDKLLSKLYENNKQQTKNFLMQVGMKAEKNTFHIVFQAANSNKKAVPFQIKLLGDDGKTLNAIQKPLNISEIVNEKMKGFHWAERLGKHRNDIIHSVNKTLSDGLAKGKTYKELSDSLKNELGTDVGKPMTIIRTEGARVYANTQQKTLDKFDKAGLAMVKTWRTVKDERVRGMKAIDKVSHVKMEGQTVGYKEDFTLPEGRKAKAPHLTGYAEHDINCRCFQTIDLAEEGKGLSSGKYEANNSGQDGIITKIEDIDYNDREQIDKLFSDFAKESKGWDIEKAIVVTEKNKAYFIDGISANVNITTVGEENLKNAIVIHNHPRRSETEVSDCFSKQDVQALYRYQIKEMQLTCDLGRFKMGYRGEPLSAMEVHERYEDAKFAYLDKAKAEEIPKALEDYRQYIIMKELAENSNIIFEEIGNDA